MAETCHLHPLVDGHSFFKYMNRQQELVHMVHLSPQFYPISLPLGILQLLLGLFHHLMTLFDQESHTVSRGSGIAIFNPGLTAINRHNPNNENTPFNWQLALVLPSRSMKNTKTSSPSHWFKTKGKVVAQNHQ